MLQYSKSIGRRHSNDDAGDSLHAGLLIETTSTASPDKYKRLWRCGFCVVGVVLTLNKKPPSSTPPPPIYVSVPPTTSDEFSRSSSSQSQFVIDIPSLFRSDEEEEEEEIERPPSFGRLSSSLSQIPIEIAPLIVDSDNDDDQEEEEEEPGSSSNEAVQDQLRRLDRIVKAKDLNSLREFFGGGGGGPEELADLFSSHLDRGLNVRVDPNPTKTTDPVRKRQLVGYFVKAGNNSTILLLSISAALSLLTEMLEQGPEQGWHDGVAILAAVVLLVTFTAAAEFLRARKMEAEEKHAARVEVVRGGRSQKVPLSMVTVGDVVELKKGDRVPADGLFVGSGTGRLMLNDEIASSVNWDQNPFLSAGFKVLEGNGRMLVTSVGTDTAIGKVMSMVKADPQERTLLQSRIEGPNSFADKIPLCISILTTLVLFIRFLRGNHGDNDNGLPELKGKIPVESLMKVFERNLLRPRGLVYILTAILTAVVLGFQHGMPLAIAVSFLYLNEKLASQAKLQTYFSCVAMGMATVICFDISGGIIYNQMEVEKVLVGREEINTDEESNISQVVLEPLRQEIHISTLMPEDLRCPADSSLNTLAQSFGNQSSQLCDVKLAAVAMEFSKEGRRVLVRKNGDDERTMHLHWRGPAQTVLHMCSHFFDCRGIIHPLGNQRSEFEEQIRGMEDEGLHPIAFAYKGTDVEEITEDGLNLLALVAFKFREETKSAIESLKRKGLKIILVTGDELGKAEAFAIALGIHSPGSDDVALIGEDFRGLGNSNERERLERTTVIGKCHPEDKLCMVKLLKELGHVVVVYGASSPGDAAALKEADVGITEEVQSPERARESCNIVITNGRGLSSLPELVKPGRWGYHNLQKFIELQLTVCISGVLISAVSTMSLGESPLTVLQLLWANLIVCILGGTMMVMEPPNCEQSAHQPRPTRAKSFMTMVMWRNLTVQVLYQSCVLLILRFVGQEMNGMGKSKATTMIFNTFILCQVFNLFNAMELEKKEVFLNVFQSYCFLASVGGILVAQLLVVHLATSLAPVGYVRLNWVQWAFCFLFSGSSWGFDRVLKCTWVFLGKLSLRSASSRILEFSVRSPSPYLAYIGIIFSMILVFSFSQYFKPDEAWTSR